MTQQDFNLALATTAQPRIIVIDDNPTIHSDFRKILSPDDNPHDLSEIEIDFSGCKPTQRSFYDSLDVELESAFLGEEGFQKSPMQLLKAILTRSRSVT